jgi:hypothetical protein
MNISEPLPAHPRVPGDMVPLQPRSEYLDRRVEDGTFEASRRDLSSPYRGVRLKAVRQLSRYSLRALDAVPELRELTEWESDVEMKQAIEEAVANIRGYDFTLF